MSIGPPILRYIYLKIQPWKSLVKAMCVVRGQSHIWPWNFKVKVMAKVKPIGHIWGLEINQYICFSFRGNRIILVDIQQISHLTLKIEGQGHGQGQMWW